MSDILTIARWSRTRLLRSRLLWIGILLALLPSVPALLMLVSGHAPKDLEGVQDNWEGVAELVLRFVAELVPALFLANALGDELELKTYTYLWSRPMRREALLFGKLLGALPLLLAITTVSFVLVWLLIAGPYAGTAIHMLWPTMVAGLAATLTACCFAIGVGALVPKHPFVLALGVLAASQVISIVPNVARLSVAFHARALAGQPAIEGITESKSAGATGLVVLASIWLVVAVWRARRAELAAIDV